MTNLLVRADWSQPPLDNSGPHRPRAFGLGPMWPIWVAIPGLIVWWALGFGFLARLSIILPMGIGLMMTRNVRTPPRFWIFGVFVAWTFLTSLQLPAADLITFLLLRGTEYVAIILAVLWVYNVGPSGQTTWVRRAFLWAWLGMTALGLIAAVDPHAQLPSLARAVLPGAIANNGFVQQLTIPALAQVHSFLGFELPRPSAPYAYANGWGSAFALLLPFVIATAIEGRTVERRLARIGLVLSLVPVVLSMNRAMWGSIMMMLVVMVPMTNDPALRRTLARAAAVAMLVLVLASVTPLGDLVSERLDTPHSNNARSDLATQAFERTMEHPIIGHGAPIEYEGSGIRPPVGTQGQLWLMLISNGIPAPLLFTLYFAAVFPLLRAPRNGTWARSAILAMFVQLPFYGLLGGQLLIVMVGVAAAQREVDEATEQETLAGWQLPAKGSMIASAP